ncbi:protein [Lentinula edodes]|uniref:Protein n=1 Tax=Lentinula edodes TaxID=5353 RepID=A0A1Q3ETE3_LENED|nr:protein [Lentinula edodes]
MIFPSPTCRLEKLRIFAEIAGNVKNLEVLLALPYPSPRSNFSPVPPHAQLNMSMRLPPLSSMGMLPPLPQFNFVGIQPYQQAAQTLGVGSSTVNPASAPLPDDDEDDFPPPSKILSEIARAATKVGGACHSVSKGKGKAKATPDVDDDDTTSQKRKRGSQKGRTSGSSNYTDEDLGILFEILRRNLPLGQRAWSRCADEFNEQAEQQGRPTRLAKSLELKYKQLVKTTKPTGDAELPRNVEDALEIEEMMNDKAGTRDLDDSDIGDFDDNDSDSESDKENAPTQKKSKATVKKQSTATGPVARRRATGRQTSVTSSRDFIDTLSAALDPVAQTARAEEQSSRTLQATSMLTMSSQLRELQCTTENLRQRLDESQRDLMQAERRANRAEMCADRLEMMSAAMQTPIASARSFRPPSHGYPVPPHAHVHNHEPATEPERWVRQEIHYPEGGRSSRWFNVDEDILSPGRCALLHQFALLVHLLGIKMKAQDSI